MTDHNADQFDRQLAEHEAKWDKGHFPAVIEAFALCAVTGHPMPEWLSESVHAALQFTLQEGGKDGNRRKGGYGPQARRTQIDQWRWSMAEFALKNRDLLPHWGFESNRDGAFEYASAELVGTPAQGSADAIKKSHERHQRSLKTAPV